MKPVEITLDAVDYSDTTQPLHTDAASVAALDAIRDRIKKRDKTYQIETGRDLIKAKSLTQKVVALGGVA